MKFQPDATSPSSIHAYGPGWIQVGTEKITHSVVLSSRGQRLNWDCACFENLSAAHFEQLAGLGTELVIFGSGDKLRFVSPALTQALVLAQIGLETMNTPAACRTYNLLANEGRIVCCALLMR